MLYNQKYGENSDMKATKYLSLQHITSITGSDCIFFGGMNTIETKNPVLFLWFVIFYNKKNSNPKHNYIHYVEIRVSEGKRFEVEMLEESPTQNRCDKRPKWIDSFLISHVF